jgi:hypothetical protein
MIQNYIVKTKIWQIVAGLDLIHFESPRPAYNIKSAALTAYPC